MNRWLETDIQKTSRSIINVLNESAAGMVKKEINKDKPEEAPKEEKVALEKRVTKAAIKGRKPESKNAKMPEKTAKKIVKEELEPEAEKSIEDQIADLQDYLNNTPEIAEDEKEAIQAEIDDLISQLGEDEMKDSNLNEDAGETATFEIDYADDDVDLSTEESVVEAVRNWLGTLASEVKIEVPELNGPAGGWPIVRLIGNKEKIAKFLLDNYNSGGEETLDDVYDLYLQENKLQEDNLKLPSEEHPEETKKFINDYQDKKYYQLTKIGLEENKKIKTETTAEKSAKNIAGAMAKKESLEQNEEDGWGEDVLEICEPFFEKVERTMYEVRNARRGSYAHFGDTVSDLAAWMGELSTEAEDVQSELDDMKEQLQESDNEPKTVKEYRIMDGNKVLKTFSADEYDKGYAEMRAMGKALKDAGKEDNLIYKEFTVKNKLKEEYSEKFGGDPKDFIGDLISVKHQLSKLNLDGFGSHLARQMVEDFIDTCDRQIKKAKRLASGNEFYTESKKSKKIKHALKESEYYYNSDYDERLKYLIADIRDIKGFANLLISEFGESEPEEDDYNYEEGCHVVNVGGTTFYINKDLDDIWCYDDDPEFTMEELCNNANIYTFLEKEGLVSDYNEYEDEDDYDEDDILVEADDRTYKDRDEAEYYRNKELYANSNLARHREAMEKAKKACEEKGIKLDEDNYLSPTRKQEPLDLVAYEPEITSIDEVKDKYVKIRGDFHRVIDVKPEGDKFVISFAAGTGTAIGGEFEPATLDEIKRLQLYTENK